MSMSISIYQKSTGHVAHLIGAYIINQQEVYLVLTCTMGDFLVGKPCQNGLCSGFRIK